MPLSKSNDLDLFGLPALRTLDYVETNSLAFLKATETVALNRSVMDEDIFSALTAEKAKALRIVKPFHCALFHERRSFECSMYR
jgi:hypothetical protein